MIKPVRRTKSTCSAKNNFYSTKALFRYLRSSVNGKIYVGSVTQGRFYTRLAQHLLRFNGSRLLAAAVPKYIAPLVGIAFAPPQQQYLILPPYPTYAG